MGKEKTEKTSGNDDPAEEIKIVMPEVASSEKELREKALLQEYQEIRAEIRQVNDRNDRRDLSGLVAIGAIIGYSLESDAYILLTSVPILMAYLYIIKIESWTAVLFMAEKCHGIEQKIGYDEFCYESTLGGLFGEKRDAPGRLFSWNNIPNLSKSVVLATSYVFAISGALYALHTLYDGAISRQVLLPGVALIYILLTGMVLLTRRSIGKTSDYIKGRREREY